MPRGVSYILIYYNFDKKYRMLFNNLIDGIKIKGKDEHTTATETA